MLEELENIVLKVNEFKSEVEKLKFYSNSEFQEVNTSSKTSDIVILSSTQQEFDEVFNILESPDIINIANDTIIYYKGLIQGKNQKLSVVIPVPVDMGIASAAITTTKCISNFSPKYVFMIGIAAGIKSQTKVGDVIIGDKVLNYNEVVEIEKPDKSVRTKYMQNLISINSHLKSRLYLFLKSEDVEKISDHKILKDINRKTNFHFGLIVTGSGLIRNNQRIEQLSQDYHNIKGLDMESYGMYKAINHSMKIDAPEFVTIKSVSDYGDSSKHKEVTSMNDRNQIALYTSVKTLELFIRSEYFDR